MGIQKIQLNFDDRGQELVRKLMSWTGSTTYKDIFNNALTLLDWALDQRAHGHIVVSMDEENQTYKELVMPALQYASDIGKKREYSAEWSSETALRTSGTAPAAAKTR